ncbi:translation machinery-associated protein 16 isoform X2 [Centruroides vittatus]|uniref:translation machinery-associated protein 16 isoform X2 n=1 Tax=Centruroides vittatus TaxID=120091 RepID=UPI0035109688
MPKVAKQKLIHPNSRKAQQLSKKQHHNIRVERKKDELNVKQQILLQKLLWFKNNLNEDEVVCAKYVLDLIESDELEQIDIINNIKGRTGIQHAARKDSIKFTTDQEKNDFQSCGLEIPDLLDEKCLLYFRSWDGSPKYLTAIRMKKYSKEKLEKLNSIQQSSSNLLLESKDSDAT